jgi:hypothetical protein
MTDSAPFTVYQLHFFTMHHPYLEVIARETGDNADDLHEFFKRKLLPLVFKTIRGEEIKLPASTTDLDKVAFGEYPHRRNVLEQNVPELVHRLRVYF